MKISIKKGPQEKFIFSHQHKCVCVNLKYLRNLFVFMLGFCLSSGFQGIFLCFQGVQKQRIDLKSINSSPDFLRK